MLTIERKELQRAVKSPKGFFLDLQKKHAPRLLVTKVRPMLESRDAYTEVRRCLSVLVSFCSCCAKAEWPQADLEWEPDVRRALIEIIDEKGFASVLKSAHLQ